MRRFLLYLLLLTAGFALMNVIYLVVMQKVDWNFSKATEAAEFKGRDFKVLVFGNSTAMDGVNTEILTSAFGEAYNFAVGGATLEANWIQYDNYLRFNQRPDKVLLFLSSCHVSYENQSGVNPVIADGSQGFQLKLSDIPLHKFRWLFVENVKKLVSREQRTAKLERGQLRMHRVIADSGEASDVNCIAVDYTAHEFAFLWRLAERCALDQIEFYVFEMPCWRRRQNDCEDIQQVVKNGLPVRVYNLNQRATCTIDPNKDWLSENHLNYSGSIKLTERLISILNGQLD